MTVAKYAFLFAALAWQPAQAFAQGVTYQRILHSQSEPQNWLTYGGSYSSLQYSSLKQIDRQNVSRLKIAWMYQPPHVD